MKWVFATAKAKATDHNNGNDDEDRQIEFVYSFVVAAAAAFDIVIVWTHIKRPGLNRENKAKLWFMNWNKVCISYIYGEFVSAMET